jgi:hypothetical protein
MGLTASFNLIRIRLEKIKITSCFDKFFISRFSMPQRGGSPGLGANAILLEGEGRRSQIDLFVGDGRVGVAGHLGAGNGALILA